MSVHLNRELEKIKKLVLKMVALIQETIDNATRSVKELDLDLAQSVMKGDGVIDEIEIEVEEECLKTLALHQPVGIDLRYLISVLKINSDLERMGDLSVNIARTTRILKENPDIKMGFDFSEIETTVRGMVKDASDALFERDADLARKVIETDDKVDAVKKASGEWAIERVKRDPEHAEVYMRYHSCIRNLERIADLATNIAEDVVYLREGKIVRHQMGGD